jgi:hypothetical protein
MYNKVIEGREFERAIIKVVTDERGGIMTTNGSAEVVARRLLLVEMNEITWSLIDPLIERKKLPTFEWLKRHGAWAAPMSVDLEPQLDPWITWTTIYTGRLQADHNVYFLDQDHNSIMAERIWEICARSGKKIGVYGSLCSWPPQPVNGFCVPDTFARDASTYPECLRAIQELNLTYTRSIRLPMDQDTFWYKAKLGLGLMRLGLSVTTISRIARQLAVEKLKPETRWRRVLLQPYTNFDFFSRLYRQCRPDFATFHTNHVAHLMHTYWKAMQPELFKPLTTTPDEIKHYGNAIEEGYVSADRLLKSLLSLIDENTVMMISSSMGQQPYLNLGKYKNGKKIRQVKSLPRLLQILGVHGQAEAVSMMSDQFNIYSESEYALDLVYRLLKSAYVEVENGTIPMFYLQRNGGSICVSLIPDEVIDASSRCRFPDAPEGPSFIYGDLVQFNGQVKSGRHHPEGMLIIYGPGIKRGGRIEECNNLDLAPTMLTLMGIPLPEEMPGRVLTEAFETRAQMARAA